MTKNKYKGFTLLELMIVVAVIGILAAVALPRFKDYLTRSQVAEAIALGGGIKKALSEWGTDKNIWPTVVDSNVLANAQQMNATVIGKFSSVGGTVDGIFPDGVISIWITKGQADGSKLTFTTNDGGISWACGNTQVAGVSGAGTTIDSKYLPLSCR